MAHLVCPKSLKQFPHTYLMGGSGWCLRGCGFNCYAFPTGYEWKKTMPPELAESTWPDMSHDGDRK